ncbi:MAG: phosphatidate cytidylyltransferase, partial [Myxococcota bacterium]
PVIGFSTLLVTVPQLIAIALTALLSAQLVRELIALLRLNGRPGAVYACATGLVLHYAAMGLGWGDAFFPLILGWVLVGIPTVCMLTAEPLGFTTACSRSQWIVLVAVLGASHLPWLLAQDLGAKSPNDVVAFILFVTFSGDAMQWVWGKLCGRHPLAPRVSPKKTWEGLVGGAATVALLSAFIAPSLGMTRGVGAGLGAVIVVVGLTGDLVISALKRDMGRKDSGTLLPGQGGLLDRMDGLLFTAPVGAQLAVWLS